MGNLNGITFMSKQERAKVRLYAPSTWQFEGLQVPSSGKWFQFFIKQTDLVRWAGGVDAVKAKCQTAEEAERYLWNIYEWQSRFVYIYFKEVVDTNLLSRLRLWCITAYNS